jgi:hypothetical protein
LTNLTGCFKVRAMSLIRGLFWLVLFIFFTFSFVVLFEYGTHDFTNGFKQEAERVKNFCVDMVQKPKASPSPGARKK